MLRFLPFEMVDSYEFHAFVAELNSTINMKNSRTYSRQMEQYSAEILEQVKEVITRFCTASPPRQQSRQTSGPAGAWTPTSP